MNKRTHGFTLIEVLVYVVVVVLITAAIGYFMTTVYQAYRITLLRTLADQTGVGIMTQVLRETRSGSSINTGASVFDSATGAISFTAASGTTNVFSSDGSDLMYREGGGVATALNPVGIAVTRFLTTYINTPVSEAVRYDIGLTYTVNGSTETKYYRGAAILRSSYD